MSGPLTVGQLRALLLKVPDDTRVYIEDADTSWDMPVEGVYVEPLGLFVRGDYATTKSNRIGQPEYVPHEPTTLLWGKLS